MMTFKMPKSWRTSSFAMVSPKTEKKKIVTSTMYLIGDTKLWWRTKYTDIEKDSNT